VEGTPGELDNPGEGLLLTGDGVEQVDEVSIDASLDIGISLRWVLAILALNLLSMVSLSLRLDVLMG